MKGLEMKKYQLRRAIRQTCILAPPPPYSETEKYDAWTLGRLIDYTAKELEKQLPAYVRKMESVAHPDPSRPLVVMPRTTSTIPLTVDGSPAFPEPERIRRYDTVLPKRFVVRSGDGPALNVFIGYSSLMETVYFFRVKRLLDEATIRRPTWKGRKTPLNRELPYA